MYQFSGWSIKLNSLDLAQPDRLSWHLQFVSGYFFFSLLNTAFFFLYQTASFIDEMNWTKYGSNLMKWPAAASDGFSSILGLWAPLNMFSWCTESERVELSVHCPTVIWILSDKLQISQRESIQMEWQSFSLKPALQNEFLTESDHYITTIIIKAWSHHLGSNVGPILTMPA